MALFEHNPEQFGVRQAMETMRRGVQIATVTFAGGWWVSRVDRTLRTSLSALSAAGYPRANKFLDAVCNGLLASMAGEGSCRRPGRV
jgi:hypothetical protein